MGKKKVTGIICIPTVSNPGNAFEALNRVSGMLGHFHCESNDDVALLKYNGIVSNEHKDKLEEIVKPYNLTLMYIELYDDDDRATDNTINLIDHEEI